MNITLKKEVVSLYAEIEERLASPIYLVGGFTRDTLMGKDPHDLDFACPCLPQVLFDAYPDALRFEKYGTVTFKENGYHITLASLRKESGYFDHRHPSKVSFGASLEEDSQRRDFTINAIYAKKDGSLIDPQKGLEDFKKKEIKIIGDKKKRLTEDPLRILRAYRFAYSLSFSFEKETEEAIQECLSLLHELNPGKIKEEVSKVPSYLRESFIKETGILFVYNEEGEKQHGN